MGIIGSVLRRLLPTGRAWRLLPGKYLDKLLEGLSGIGEDAREYAGESYLDFFPSYTRELEEWEQFYGLRPAIGATEQVRRQALAAEWRSTGGQSAAYIQGVLQTAGFAVYVYDAWESGPSPWVPRDPRDYVEPSYSGSVQCGETWAECGDEDAQCDDFLIGDPNYWASLGLTQSAQPPIPTDPARWPFFIYVAGSPFPEEAVVAAARMPELQRLLQKLKPSQMWVVLMAASTDAYVAMEDGSEIVMEDGSLILVE